MTKKEQQREKYFSEINNELSNLNYNLAKNIYEFESSKSKELDNFEKLLGLKRLENESDEEFRKRLSEKLPH